MRSGGIERDEAKSATKWAPSAMPLPLNPKSPDATRKRAAPKGRDEEFNMFHGAERFLFHGKDGLRIDVFFDILTMSHKLDLRGRLELDYPTISLTDLLMTKLQIVELNEKDVKDMICLLNDHDLADSDQPEKINSKYVADLCSKDWGVCKTFTMNLNRILTNLEKLGSDEKMRARVAEQCRIMLDQIEKVPKSTKWKMRAKVGEKKRWYQLPED